MEGERVFKNIKYCQRHAVASIAVWVFLFFAPGVLIGRFAGPVLSGRGAEIAGVTWMFVGAAFMFAFARKCFMPRTLVVTRDGFRIDWREKPLIALNFEKIHEARWEDTPSTMRKLFGPLVFLEPLWPLQDEGERELVIVHAGAPVRLREDEFEGLDEFAEALARRNVKGLAPEGARPLPVYGK